jgi:putative ABC transport system permease protein
MLSVYQTLSYRYLSRRWFRALLIVASIALGVATLVATQALNDTMTKATLARINPMPAVADFVVSYSEAGVSSDLARTLQNVSGVQDASPRIFDTILIPELGNRSVQVIGLELKREYNKTESLVNLSLDKDLLDALKHAEDILDAFLKNNKKIGNSVRELLNLQVPDEKTAKLILDYLDRLESGQRTDEAVFDMVKKFLPPVMVGEELMSDLTQAAARRKSGLPELFRAVGLQDNFLHNLVKDAVTSFPQQFKNTALNVFDHQFEVRKVLVQKTKTDPPFKESKLLRVGTVTGKGHAAFLGGYVLILDIDSAADILGMEAGKVSRIDVTLATEADKNQVREALEEAARGHGVVQTPEEHTEALGSALSGMQTGFSLCGLAALVVGLFLVYNALSVSVAERRHEIGVLLSLGATQQQVRLLFAGEAAFLGVLGSLLGIPLGIALAYFGLQPAQDVLGEIFVKIKADQVEVSWWLMSLAVACGVLTSLVAGLLPAVAASRENPASAVRQVSKAPTWSNLSSHIFCSLGLLGAGALVILFREQLSQLQEPTTGSKLAMQSHRLGTYGGMILFLLGALLAAPLLAAVIARMIQPLARRCFPITWRLAADNLVLSPGRTGLVIAALAAGVALVTQTYGTIASNQVALRDWVRESIAADLIVMSGSPIGVGGDNSEFMKEDDGDIMRKIDGVEAVLPMKTRKIPFGGTTVRVFALDAGGTYDIDKNRQAELQNLELYKTLSENPNTVIVSDNFRALHGIGKGDILTLNAGGDELKFEVIGTMLDYGWNHGTIFIDRERYKQLWKDHAVEMFDVFVQRGSDLSDEQFAARVEEVQRNLRVKVGVPALVVHTRGELQERILDMIDRIYAIALSQQFVVMFVAALGVVTALLISVLQRRREMGLLRAIGASRNQVVRSVLAEACLMGVIGTIIGLLVGIPLQWYIVRVVILEESGYLFPVLIPWTEGLLIAAAAMGTATLAGLGPALHSVRLRIPEAIAYE